MGLLNLIALSYLSIISIVVFIHFFNRKSNIVYVPSIIPWKEINTDAVASRLFRFNLLFLLQIFLIILLSLFLARPYISSDILIIHGRNKVVVVDTSASMQTIEREGSRFDQAKEQILSLIDGMKSTDKMMIISAYSSSEVVIGLTGDKELLQKSVEGLKPTETGTDLEGGISHALSYMENMKNSQLYIFTDQQIEDSGSKINEIDPKSYQFARFGRSSANVAILSFDTFQDMFNKNDQAYITLKNLSDEPKDVRLTVHMEQNILMKRELQLNDHEQKTFTIQNISLPGVLKAQIETNDDLKADNVAFAIIKKRKKLIDILMVTNSERLRAEFQRLERAFSQMKIKTVSMDEYNHDILQNYDICIFHKFIPDKQPGINSIFIIPNIVENIESETSSDKNELGRKIKDSDTDNVSQNSEIWRSFLLPKGIVQNVQILDWDNMHPTMKYLDYLDNIKTYGALLFEPPKDARVLIHASGQVSGAESSLSSKGLRNDLPLAFSAKLGNKRTIVIGLDLSDFSYSDNNNLPILIMTLNMIQWLSPLGENLDSFGRSNLTVNDRWKTGDLYPVQDHDNFEGLSIIENDDTKLPISDFEIQQTDSAIQLAGRETNPADAQSKIGRFRNYITIKYAGIYVVKRKDKDEIFVANLFNESESNIKPHESESQNNHSILTKAQMSDNATLSTAKEEINEISRYILYLVPLLLLVEWIYSFVKKSSF